MDDQAWSDIYYSIDPPAARQDTQSYIQSIHFAISTSQPYLPQSKKANIPQMPFFKPPSYMEKKKDMRAETKRNIAENQTLLPRLLHRLLL